MLPRGLVRLHNLCGKDALRYTVHLSVRPLDKEAVHPSHSCSRENRYGVARASFLIILLPAGQA